MACRRARASSSSPAISARARRRWSAIWSIRSMPRGRSEEHTSELQSLMRISYAVFCLKKKYQKLHYCTQVQDHKSDHNIATQQIINHHSIMMNKAAYTHH